MHISHFKASIDYDCHTNSESLDNASFHCLEHCTATNIKFRLPNMTLFVQMCHWYTKPEISLPPVCTTCLQGDTCRESTPFWSNIPWLSQFRGWCNCDLTASWTSCPFRYTQHIWIGSAAATNVPVENKKGNLTWQILWFCATHTNLVSWQNFCKVEFGPQGWCWL